MVRIVGDVRLGDRARIGQRTAIRADEGTPIIIGRNARIGNRVTFHALEHTSLVVGDTATIGEECVLHGPVTAGSLHDAVERQSGSAGNLFGTTDRCRRLDAARTWRCSVYDSAGSGGVDYRVRARSGSSCFDGRITADYGEGGLPKRISGCVYRWQWSAFDLL
jgi:NDP-sugar pyrophosphorylase family protein